MQIADGKQRVDAVFDGFADSDEQAGGERDILLAGLFDGAQAFGRNFVGSIVMSGAGGEQRGVRGLEHKAHAGRYGGQSRDPLRAEQAGIRMREQAGLAQHQFAHGFKVVQRGLVAEVAQGFAHLGEKQFGLVAEREEGFGASQFFAGAGDCENFVGSHRVRAGIAGIAAEGAVSAVVAAEIGQRQEDFSRVGDDAGLEALFGGAGGGEKFGKIVVGAANEVQGGLARDGDAGADLGERRGACRALLGGGGVIADRRHLNRMIQRQAVVM